ncbi:MAG: hypothetical protein QGG36_27905 [Pirellulaceae bacterium]|jgi:hypothetical protein|nr:hypothetical protein [Pirellulaceae bacterium]
MNLVQRLWADEAGFVISSELVLVATVLVIGMLVGLATLRDQVLQELADVADAISEINQSYSFTGVTGHTATTAGSVYQDLEDFCDDDATGGSGAECLDVTHDATDEGGI